MAAGGWPVAAGARGLDTSARSRYGRANESPRTDPGCRRGIPRRARTRAPRARAGPSSRWRIRGSATPTCTAVSKAPPTIIRSSWGTSSPAPWRSRRRAAASPGARGSSCSRSFPAVAACPARPGTTRSAPTTTTWGPGATAPLPSTSGRLTPTSLPSRTG